MIAFNVPYISGFEKQYIDEVITSKLFSGSHSGFNQRCCDFLRKNLQSEKVFLVPSCTHALEMSALLIDIQPGDEVIMPSYTFVSTANAFILQGARIVFVDIKPGTMNMDENLIEAAITPKTKAIVPVHYAGIGCDMDAIMCIARRHDLFVIEDAAQAIGARYKDRNLGSIGDFGCFSFHESKNIHCGEGGALSVNNADFISRAEIIREKGTDRTRFFRGEIDKYTWVDIGSSYLLSELNSAFLFAQLESLGRVTEKRSRDWETYHQLLGPVLKKGLIELLSIPGDCSGNGHIFLIKLENIESRERVSRELSSRNIFTTFHYVPLHSSTAGRKYSRFHGVDRWTTSESERLLRLPMHYALKPEEIEFVAKQVTEVLLKVR